LLCGELHLAEIDVRSAPDSSSGSSPISPPCGEYQPKKSSACGELPARDRVFHVRIRADLAELVVEDGAGVLPALREDVDPVCPLREHADRVVDVLALPCESEPW